jgi:IS5 family transposase
MDLQRQPGFFDLNDRAAKLTALGDPLVTLKAEIDFEAFRADLARVHHKPRKSNAGAKPFDVVLMFRVLILQHRYNLSADGIEYQIRDRLSFMRFLGLQMEDRVPDAKTVWLFRERLKTLGLVEVLFARFDEQLARRGYVAKTGQMIDATFVEAPRQRNSREENAKLKAGEIPDGWDAPEQAAKRRQKDTDARWTQKHDETYCGYKNHINADAANKLIQDYAITPAHGHDSQVLDDLLDVATTDDQGRKRPVSADSAYRSEAREADLAKQGLESQIHAKGTRAAPLTEQQQASNRSKSTVRARVEHLFGAQAAMDGHRVRTIGIARAKVKIGLLNLTYNMKRRVQLTALEARRQARLVTGQDGITAPAMA